MKTISIIDAGIGNVQAIKNMFEHIGIISNLVSSPELIRSADILVLPGVGSFDNAICSLRERQLINPILEAANAKRIPILGICVGMQILFSRSEEGVEKGLDIIPGSVVKFENTLISERSKLKVPHIGWNKVNIVDKDLLEDSGSSEFKFYFAHSYYARLENDRSCAAWCDYGVRFPAAVRKANIFGVQFHPEKSHKYGAALLRNFFNFAFSHV